MDTLQKFITLLQSYISRRWFGKITISVESGNIVNVKVEENIKL
jgi:hypothetical protein